MITKAFNWNPWHGCHKISPGCQHCYVYRSDARYDRDSSVVKKNSDFDLPLRRTRLGEWKIPARSLVWTCFTSDFLVPDADQWRDDAWDIIRKRHDLHFLFITKRIERFADCIPSDWGSGWPHVTICCTCENQRMADLRLPVFRDAPIVHKEIVNSPLLERIDMSAYLGDWVQSVTVGGESGPQARVCNYDWVLDIRSQCVQAGIPFIFQQTGAKFIKDGQLYYIPRKLQHSQARKANINYSVIKST